MGVINRLPLSLVLWLLIALVPTVQAEEQALVRTTSSPIAIKNLDFLIRRAELQLRASPHNQEAVATYLEMLLLKVSFLNTFKDFQRALRVTNELISARPNDPGVLLLSAKVLQALHRFSPALIQLEKAAELTSELSSSEQARFRRQIETHTVTINVARGDTEQALRSLKNLQETSPNSADASRLAVLFAAVYRSQGLLEAADKELVKSLENWDRITPFTIAWVSFQRGEVWVGVDDARAQKRYEEALHYLPEYVTARVHLAELKHQAGDTHAAIKLLEPIAKGQDPEPAGRLAEFLTSVGKDEESLAHRNFAERGWEELLENYPLTFADHGAEFWLGAGGNPVIALKWARLLYENQPTTKAKSLLAAAIAATDSTGVN